MKRKIYILIILIIANILLIISYYSYAYLTDRSSYPLLRGRVDVLYDIKVSIYELIDGNYKRIEELNKEDSYELLDKSSCNDESAIISIDNGYVSITNIEKITNCDIYVKKL